ncbi:MAG: translation initiation factor IF-2 N-terminal domain-containing protein, partial [Ilumatobacteraceae bacterium]
MAKNLRVHELAKELGMTNAETVDLCGVLGIPVKSHSSSLQEAYADMVPAIK